MQITRQADYAMRCVLYLSRNPDRVSSVGEISEKMNIPRNFLAKILQRLVRAGVVKSVQGVKGGFHLARRPKDINLLDVIEAIDGPAAMNKCAIDKRLCNLSNTCTIHPIWIEMRRVVEKRLKGCNFARLASLKR